MEHRRADPRTNENSRASNHPARPAHEREVTALGRSLDVVLRTLAQSVGGWWAERDVAAALRRVTFEDDVVYRAHYDFSPTRLADRSYEMVRPAYLVGHIAGTNPSYDGAAFEGVESDLRSGWTDEIRAKHGDWEAVRQYAKEAFGRVRQRAIRASGEHRRVSIDSEPERDAESGSAD